MNQRDAQTAEELRKLKETTTDSLKLSLKAEAITLLLSLCTLYNSLYYKSLIYYEVHQYLKVRY